VRIAVHGGAVTKGQPTALHRAGDLTAWRDFYERYLPLVYRVAGRMGVPDSELGDVCQEVFLRAYRGMGAFRGEAQVGTWLYTIVVREAARARRARVVRTALLALLGRQPPEVAPDLVARSEAAREVERVLGGLKPRQREVLVLFDLEERTLEEIAEILGCPLETVRSRLRLARAEFSRIRAREALARGGSR
jgi:RNA polymerase sigma-70 factor (ECF subfamily)